MDLVRKVQIAEAAIKSIAEHDDAPAELVEAALAEVTRKVREHGAAAKARREKKSGGSA